MTAPLRQRIKCLTQGHDWRLAIDPEGGFYQRCRRCWRTCEAPDEVIEKQAPPVKPALPRIR
jgi:hypothetical protein